MGGGSGWIGAGGGQLDERYGAGTREAAAKTIEQELKERGVAARAANPARRPYDRAPGWMIVAVLAILAAGGWVAWTWR